MASLPGLAIKEAQESCFQLPALDFHGFRKPAVESWCESRELYNSWPQAVSIWEFLVGTLLQQSAKCRAVVATRASSPDWIQKVMRSLTSCWSHAEDWTCGPGMSHPHCRALCPKLNTCFLEVQHGSSDHSMLYVVFGRVGIWSSAL